MQDNMRATLNSLVRTGCTILEDRHSFACEMYNEYVEQLIDALNSEEPLVCCLAVQAVASCAFSVQRWSTCALQSQLLASALLRLLVEDKNQHTRVLATKALSHLIIHLYINNGNPISHTLCIYSTLKRRLLELLQTTDTSSIPNAFISAISQSDPNLPEIFTIAASFTAFLPEASRSTCLAVQCNVLFVILSVFCAIIHHASDCSSTFSSTDVKGRVLRLKQYNHFASMLIQHVSLMQKSSFRDLVRSFLFPVMLCWYTSDDIANGARYLTNFWETCPPFRAFDNWRCAAEDTTKLNDPYTVTRSEMVDDDAQIYSMVSKGLLFSPMMFISNLIPVSWFQGMTGSDNQRSQPLDIVVNVPKPGALSTSPFFTSFCVQNTRQDSSTRIALSNENFGAYPLLSKSNSGVPINVNLWFCAFGNVAAPMLSEECIVEFFSPPTAKEPNCSFKVLGSRFFEAVCPISLLNFSYCTLKCPKVLSFPILNLSRFERVFTFGLKNSVTCFRINPPHMVLLPNEYKEITVLTDFDGIEEGRTYKNTITVICEGTVIHKITTKAILKMPFEVSTKKLSFGIVDPFGDKTYAKFWLTNNTQEHLHLVLRASTSEIIVPAAIILLPQETRKITAEFNASWAGPRKEWIQVLSVGGVSTMIKVLAQVGNNVIVPVHDCVCFLPTLYNDASVVFPICFMKDTQTTVEIVIPAYFDAAFAEQKGIANTAPQCTCQFVALLGEEKIFSMRSTGICSGQLILTLHGKELYGLATRTMQVYELCGERRVLLSSHVLHACALSINIFEEANILNRIKQFFELPENYGISNVIARGKLFPNKSDASFVTSANCIELTPKSFVLNRNSGTQQLQLFNQSNTEATFHLLYPNFIHISGEPKCSVPAFASTVLTFTVGVPRSCQHISRSTYALHGFIAVLENSDQKRLVSSTIVYNGDEAPFVDIIGRTPRIFFTGNSSCKTVSRKLIVRNNGPVEKVLEGSISSEDNLPGSFTRKYPFNFGNSRVKVKPYSISTIEVVYQPSPKCRAQASAVFKFRNAQLVMGNDSSMQQTATLCGHMDFIPNKSALAPVFFNSLPLLKTMKTKINLADEEMMQYRQINLLGDYCKAYVCLDRNTLREITISFTTTKTFFCAGHVSICVDRAVLSVPFFVQSGTPLVYFDQKVLGSFKSLRLGAGPRGIFRVTYFELENLGTVPAMFEMYAEKEFDGFDCYVLTQMQYQINQKIVRDALTDQFDLTEKMIDCKGRRKALLYPRQKLYAAFCSTYMLCGDVSTQIECKVRSFFGTETVSRFNVQAEIRAPVTFTMRNIDFGQVETRNEPEVVAAIRNNNSSSVQWKIFVHSCKLTDSKSKKPLKLRSLGAGAVIFFPSHGIIPPRSTMPVAVTLRSPYDSSSIVAKCVLRTAYNTTTFMVTGTISQPILRASNHTLDFKTVLVRTYETRKFTIENVGGLDAEFLVTSSCPFFMCEPERGIIHSDEEIELTVSFISEFITRIQAELTVHYSTGSWRNVRSLVIFARAVADYPSLVVYTKTLDYGVALLGIENIGLLSVENKGIAQAQMVLCTSIPSLHIALDDSIIPPKTAMQARLIFHPTTLEDINVSISLRSDDCKSETFNVCIKAKVGVASLAIEPLELFENFDFGTCLISGTFKNTLQVKNKGNIPFTYCVMLEWNSSSPCPFLLGYQSARIDVDESKDLEVFFRPLQKTEYSCVMRIVYGSQAKTISTLVRGIGGKVQFSLSPPISMLQFGTCRVKVQSRRHIDLQNLGNYGVQFEAELTGSSQFRLSERVGYCRAESRVVLDVLFTPDACISYQALLRIKAAEQTHEVEVFGSGGVSQLVICNNEGVELDRSKGKKDNPSFEMGVCGVNKCHLYYLQLRNDGPYGVNFFVEPFRTQELNVFPKRGFVTASGSASLVFGFCPTSEEQYSFPLTVLWDKEPCRLTLTAVGGRGVVDVKYGSPSDAEARCVDFGMVPVSTCIDKGFFILNRGLVAEVIEVYVVDDVFSLAVRGRPQPCSTQVCNAPYIAPTERTLRSFGRSFKLRMEKNSIAEVALRFVPTHSRYFRSNIQIVSNNVFKSIDISGKGGSFQLAHHGSLRFDGVSVGSVVSRKISLRNAGSIAATLTFGWLLARDSQVQSAQVDLSSGNSLVDPQYGWARKNYVEKNKIDSARVFSVSDYWKMLRSYVIIGVSMAKGINAAKCPNELIVAFQRKVHLFNILKNTPISSQQILPITPFLRVEPSSCTLVSGSEAILKVELLVRHEEPIIAVLVCQPSVPGTKNYEIPFIAQPRFATAFVDDLRPIDFRCQKIGHRETLRRIITNTGGIPLRYNILHENHPLTVFPNRGSLQVGQSVAIEFTYYPLNETPLVPPMIIQIDGAQPITLGLAGSGGNSVFTFPQGRKMEFGCCMIGKDIIGKFAISVEGTALLHLTHFDLYPSDSFFKGPNWPTSRVTIEPGKTFYLQFLFNPKIESPTPGKAMIANESVYYEIVLTGQGREAVLIVAETLFEFFNCVVGKTYQKKLHLNNVGDVNYPVSFTVESEKDSFSFSPSSMVFGPYSKAEILINFTPSHEMNVASAIVIDSPYAKNRVPLVLVAGEGNLDLSTYEIDLGLIEKNHSETRTIKLKNPNNVILKFNMKSPDAASTISFSPAKGTINPGQIIDLVMTCCPIALGKFIHNVQLSSDVPQRRGSVTVIFECQEAVLRPEDFRLINFGICPVLEVTQRSFTLKNYGLFPLKFQIKAPYPLKANITTGTLMLEETAEIVLSWTPTGSYEMRVPVQVVSNAGNHAATVRGRAAFPDLSLRTTSLDFGACSVGYEYREWIEFYNRGRVLLSWKIQKMREGFSMSRWSGTLVEQESAKIEVIFRPTTAGRVTTSCNIECRGQGVKEIQISAAVGMLSLSVPAVWDVRRCPCKLWVTRSITIRNKGDIPVVARLQTTPGLNSSTSKAAEPAGTLAVPPAGGGAREHGSEVLSHKFCPAERINPGVALTMTMEIKCSVAGPFTKRIWLWLRERTYSITVKGSGERIEQTEQIKRVLAMPVADVTTPLQCIVPFEEIDYQIERLQREIPRTLARIGGMTLAEAREFGRKREASGTVPMRCAAFALDREEHFMSEICNFPKPRLPECNISQILAVVQPDLSINLSLVFGRPPPFADEDQEAKEAAEAAIAAAEAATRSKKYREAPLAPLRRIERRTRSVHPLKVQRGRFGI